MSTISNKEIINIIRKEFKIIDKGKPHLYEINQLYCDKLEKAIDSIDKNENEILKLKNENMALYRELAKIQNIPFSSAKGNFLYKYKKELENESPNLFNKLGYTSVNS